MEKYFGTVLIPPKGEERIAVVQAKSFEEAQIKIENFVFNAWKNNEVKLLPKGKVNFY